MGNTVLAATAAKSTGFNPSTLIIILVIVVAIYMLMIRPQRRRQQAAMQQRNQVTPGARVRTTAGMYATVIEVDGDDVVLEVAPGIEVRYMKRAIMDVVSPGEEEAPSDTSYGFPEDDAAEDATDDTGEAGDVDDEAGETGEVDDEAAEPGAGEEAEEDAYEKATGTKKD